MNNKYWRVSDLVRWDLQARLAYICNRCGAWKRDPAKCVGCPVDEIFDNV